MKIIKFRLYHLVPVMALLLMLLLAACAALTPTPTPTPTPPGPSVALNLTAQNIAFDLSAITVPPGASVTINFTNKDAGIPHNFSVYTNSNATTSIFVGQFVTGPGTATYIFTAPATAGTYFFRCDVHPSNMTGSLIVTAPASGGGGY